MQGIRIGIQKVGTQFDICLLNISGYVDTTTCQELTQTIQALTDQKNILFITDLGGVTYISSAGWGVFMGEIKGIREKGGDIKVVHMNPEVFEVFEMLEFNRILNYYDSVEEAINEFDLLRGFDITHSVERPPDADSSLDITREVNRTSVLSQEMTVSDFPLVEKIKRIIIENPFFSLQDIRSELNTSNYGYVRIRWWKLRSLLKSLSLETKEKRYRFYRSR
jgi:anti-anti-sigma factor